MQDTNKVFKKNKKKNNKKSCLVAAVELAAGGHYSGSLEFLPVA